MHEERRNGVARMLAQRAGWKASEDNGSFEEVLFWVVTLYEAASAQHTPSGRMLDMHEQLVRMALPCTWRHGNWLHLSPARTTRKVLVQFQIQICRMRFRAAAATVSKLLLPARLEV